MSTRTETQSYPFHALTLWTSQDVTLNVFSEVSTLFRMVRKVLSRPFRPRKLRHAQTPDRRIVERLTDSGKGSRFH